MGEGHGDVRAAAGAVPRAGRRSAFTVVTAGYLASTAAESLLAPLYPILGPELGLGVRAAGLAFGLLAASIAVGNVAGGAVLSRRGPRQGATAGLALAAAGAALAAAAGSARTFLGSQVVLGLGTGTFFASGLSAAAVLAGPRRRGLAIGFFGVAFSGGLAAAALLAVVAGRIGWRSTFVVVAGLAALVALAIRAVPVPREPPRPPRTRPPWRRVLGIPLLVGGVAAGSQYGTIAFLPTFAVTAWGMGPAAAALLLLVARVLSVPSKLLSGQGADRAGAIRVARRLGLLLGLSGAWWTLAPGPVASAWAAVLFAAFVSALGPLANVLAFEGFGDRGGLLGLFRAAQIGLGAATSAGIGGLSGLIGLRPSLALAAAAPLVLLAVGTTGRGAEAARS